MTSFINTPHDKIFRLSLQNSKVAREYIEKYYPEELLKLIDLNNLIPCPEIYINQYLTLSESDVIYKAQIAGKTGYLYFAAEHQSSSDSFMPFRILQYNVCVWRFHREQHPESKTLPLIINTVFFNGKKPYIHSTDFKDLLNAPKKLVQKFWSKPFKLIQVKNIPDKELLQQKWAGIFQYYMKNIYQPDFMPYLQKILPKLKAIEAENGIEYIEALTHYALNAAQISDTNKFIHTLKSELSESTGEKIMTGAEYLIQKGIQQGMQEGINHEKMLLKKQLIHRFSAIPQKYLNQLEKANPDELLILGERILDAQTIDDVFNNMIN